MEKSKLGISIALFSAILYFMGAAGGIIVVAIAAGYVLLFEDSEALKKTAVKALIITIILTVLTSLISFIVLIISALSNVLYNYVTQKSIYSAQVFYILMQLLPNNINYFMRILELIIPVVFGFRAYRQRDIKVKWIDNIIDKHLIKNI